MNISKAVLSFLFLGLIATPQAMATSFADSASNKDAAFNTFLTTADNRSFDGTGTSALGAFDDFVTAGLYLEFGTFDLATEFSAQLLFEMTAYDDLNEFGVLDNAGGFTSLISGSDVAGDTNVVEITDGEYRLAVKSPSGTFSAINSENSDGLSYIIGQEILRDGTVKLFGNEFNVTAGQFVIYFEDLAGAFPVSDQDFNDGVLLLTARTTEVPEPATLSLLLAGIGGLGFRRRKKA